MDTLDVKIGKLRVRCYGAATADDVYGRSIKNLGMQPGDLLVEFLGVLGRYTIVKAGDRAALADAIAPLAAAPPADLPDALRCEAHGVVLCVEAGCTPGAGGGS